MIRYGKFYVPLRSVKLSFLRNNCNKSNNESSHKGEKERKLLSPSRLEIICLPRYKQLFTMLPSFQGKEAVLNSSVKQILNCHTSQAFLPRPSKDGWRGHAGRALLASVRCCTVSVEGANSFISCLLCTSEGTTGEQLHPTVETWNEIMS